MANVKEVTIAYEMALASLATDENIKLDLKVPCKTTFIFALAIDNLIHPNEAAAHLRKLLSDDDLVSLEAIRTQILEKSKLTALYEKMSGYVQ
jgi:hypothetical protein